MKRGDKTIAKRLSRWPVKLLLTALVITTFSCAKPGAPSGGPRDTIPPKVISSTPENGAINFTGNSITITFDEFVNLNSIEESFMASPLIEKRPKINLRGKNLIIEFEEELRDSTTYTLYFQDAIRDLNEGNILENYRFAFSTGSYLDSLSVTGQLFDALTLEAWENYMVMLYSNLADTAPTTIAPDYITLTSRDGNFRLDNMRPGQYRLYALGDNNNNRRYDPGSEPFAFYDEVITVLPESHYITALNRDDTLKTTVADTLITDDDDTLLVHMHDTVRLADRDTLHHAVKDSLLHLHDDAEEHRHADDDHLHGEEPTHIFEELPEAMYELYFFLTPRTRYFLDSSVRPSQRQLRYYFSRSLDTLGFTFTLEEFPDAPYLQDINLTNDTISVWLLDSLHYSENVLGTIITYPRTDSLGIVVSRTDTIPLRFTPPRLQRQPRTVLTVNTDIPTAGIHPGRDLILTTDYPLRSVDTDRIYITETSDTTGKRIAVNPLFNPDNPGPVTITQNLEEDKSYLLVIEEGALQSWYTETNDSLTIPFRVRPVNSFGTLTVNLSGYAGDVVIQLLSRQESVVAELTGEAPGSFAFRFLENGMYRLRVIYDTDGNGKFSTGDFLKGIQPEKVSYFPTELEIKSNWDLMEDWDISDKRVKANTLRSQRPQRR